MNETNSTTHECNPLGLYSPDEPPVPPAMLWVAIVNMYCVIIFGILGNATALWCVATCPKTQRPVKVLLFSVFLPIMLFCMVTGPVYVEFLSALLTCDPDRIAKKIVGIFGILGVILVRIEQPSIAAISAVRAAAVWAPHRPKLGIKGAVGLVVVTCIYAVLTTLVPATYGFMKKKGDEQSVSPVAIIVFVVITLPLLITIVSYILMMFVIQRNKRRLVASQQQARMTTTMDQVTQAMLAVFISNMVFCLPFYAYRLMNDKQPMYMKLIFEIIFSLHFIADPLMYIWFNSGCREKVFSSLRKVIQSIPSSSTSGILQTSSTGSCDKQKQTSSTSRQADSPI